MKVKFLSFFFFFVSFCINSSIVMNGIPFSQRVFIKIMDNIVPSIVSPTHPEQIEYHDRKLAFYACVCKGWSKALYTRFDFKEMERLFVAGYHWPCDQFLYACNERVKFLKQHYTIVDVSWFKEQESQMNYYGKMIQLVKAYAYEKNHDSKIKQINKLKACIDKELGPLSLFFSFNKSDVWQDLFEYLFKQPLSEDQLKLVRNACINQYLSHITIHYRLDNVETFIKQYCELDLKKEFSNKIRIRVPLSNFSFAKQIEKKLQFALKEEAAKLLLGLLGAGDFLYQSLFDLVFRYVYPSNCEFISDVSFDYESSQHEIFNALIASCDGNIFLQKKLSHMLVRQEYCLDQETFAISDENLNYELFFSRLIAANKKIVAGYMNGDDVLRIKPEIISQFFKEYKEIFIKHDKKGKSFLFYLLLFLSHNKRDSCVFEFLKCFIQYIIEDDRVLFVNYISKETDRVECIQLFKKIQSMDYLSCEQVSLLKFFLGWNNNEGLF